MMDDQTLLARFASTQDAGAFEELARRHAALVKGVCIRILGNSHDAEEVAQECFLELARHAGEVHSSVIGWLHRAATSRSLNVLRSRKRRKVRERAVSHDADAASHISDPAIAELQRIIDGALTELPDDLRQPMMLHYFGGRSQRDVAVELGVNQSTISRRMRDALQYLRERLSQAGYAASAPAIMAIMQDRAVAGEFRSSQAVITSAGAATQAAGTVTLANSLKGLAAASLPAITYLFLGGWVSLAVAVCLTFYVARSKPAWVAEALSSLGEADLYGNPTFCLQRWTWTTPPVDWRQQVRSAIGWSSLFLLLTVAFVIGTPEIPWGMVLLSGGLSAGLLFHAGRIWHRVRVVCHSVNTVGERIVHSGTKSSDCGPAFESRLSSFDAVQLVVIGAAAVGLSIRLINDSRLNNIWPATIVATVVGAGMLVSGLRLSLRFWQARSSKSIIPQLNSEQSRRSPELRTVVAVGVATVVTLSCWIAWNPASISGLTLSLAALQTSMLGWIVYRLASYCGRFERTAVVRVVVAVLVGCFVMNSGVCLANWIR